MEENKVKLSKKLQELTSMPKTVKNKIVKRTIRKKRPVDDEGTSTEKTYVIPLGGLEEVGKNMTAFMYKDEMIIVDAGLSFPSDEHLGCLLYTSDAADE